MSKLGDVLNKFFHNGCKTGVFTAVGKSFGIMFHNGKYLLFDSHSNKHTGCAVLIYCNTLQQLQLMIDQRIHCPGSNLNTEICGIGAVNFLGVVYNDRVLNGIPSQGTKVPATVCSDSWRGVKHLYGTHSQDDFRFSDLTRNRQCTSMSVFSCATPRYFSIV